MHGGTRRLLSKECLFKSLAALPDPAPGCWVPEALSPRPAPSAKDEMDGNSAICRAESFLEIEGKLVFELGIG